MALVVKDRVKETSTITGTGTLTLAGAADNFQSFSVIGDGNTTYYAIVDVATGDWEVGLGTYTASGTTLSRDTVLESSNSGSLVSFAGNAVEVFCTYPAEKSAFVDDIPTNNNELTNGAGYITGNQTITLSGDVSGSGTTSISVTVADDSHNHVISNVDGLQTALDGKVNLSGDSMTGDLSFGDDDKAIFGAGSDLQIYHDGSNSYIQDAGTGNLLIRGANVEITTAVGTKYFDGAANIARLYHTGNEKLATTSTGIDVTGTVTADGLTVDNDGTLYLQSGADLIVEEGDSSNTAARIRSDGDEGFVELYEDGVNTIYLRGGGSSYFNNGNVGIGTDSPARNLTVEDTNPHISILSDSTTGVCYLDFGDPDDDNRGRIAYANGSDSLQFLTDASERMRIDSSGRLFVSTTDTNPAANNEIGALIHYNGYVNANVDNAYHRFGRNGDGSLMRFYSAGGYEGSISISGSTTSFNGGHLARWSQLTDGTKDESIVKGTVLTNLDQMAVWHHEAVEAQDAVLDEEGNVVTEAVEAKEAYTEDNEQLNCMAVSSVEGDPNVAGVFVNWDNDDDEFNDMNIAMTGDMVIRIAQGTTVARGDLLMSAGDGTAKPQGDDIVRSKTIAKVTSTNVSHTYDDGSYLVPCVLMAC
jgi:hypothetical protein